LGRGVKRKFSMIETLEVSSPCLFKVGSSDQTASEGIGNMSPSMRRLYFSPIHFHSGSDNNRTALVNRGCQQDSPKGVARVSDGVLGISNSEEPAERTQDILCTSSLCCSAGSDFDSEDEEELCEIFKGSNLTPGYD